MKYTEADAICTEQEIARYETYLKWGKLGSYPHCDLQKHYREHLTMLNERLQQLRTGAQ